MKKIFSYIGMGSFISFVIFWWAIEGIPKDPRDLGFAFLYSIGWISPFLMLLLFCFVIALIKKPNDILDTLFKASLISIILTVIFQILPILDSQNRDMGYAYLILCYPIFSVPFMVIVFGISYKLLNLMKLKNWIK